MLTRSKVVVPKSTGVERASRAGVTILGCKREDPSAMLIALQVLQKIVLPLAEYRRTNGTIKIALKNSRVITLHLCFRRPGPQRLHSVF